MYQTKLVQKNFTRLRLENFFVFETEILIFSKSSDKNDEIHNGKFVLLKRTFAVDKVSYFGHNFPHNESNAQF